MRGNRRIMEARPGESSLFRPRRYWRRAVGGIGSRRGGYLRALKWLAMYALARIVAVRRIARMLSRGDTRSAVRARHSMFDANVEEVTETLRLDGFDPRLRLPAQIVRDFVSFGEGIAGLPGVAPHSSAMRSSLALTDEIADDTTLRKIAALYLGASPFYQGSRIWWTRPGERADPLETGARFHYDLYDYSALTFLFYLTEVGPDAAPHVCVRASHRLRKWKDQVDPVRHRSDDQIVRHYGTERIVTICGPPGTGIAEDPFCFHKVKLPARRERLALQLLYTGRDVLTLSFRRAESSRSDA